MSDYQIILYAMLTLGGIGTFCAVILHVIAQKFNVAEDPRCKAIETVLPQANCGGCGFAGCKGFASACITADSLDTLSCPVGGTKVMEQIAAILERPVTTATPRIAVIRCNTDCRRDVPATRYDGTGRCSIESALYSGENGCAYGCLGQGDCIEACPFGALRFHPETHRPEILEEKCTGCGMCVKTCPRSIIELRSKTPIGQLVYVRCMNREKGAIARKTCQTACIGCSKCAKVCPHDAITVSNQLAWIDSDKCRLCGRCLTVCPTGAIHGVRMEDRTTERLS